MLTPLIRALKSILGAHPFLVYMDTFRYPLAEISLDVDLVRRLRIPYDWALEVGDLRRYFGTRRPRPSASPGMCENYDHKHQELSGRDADKGLNKMAVDIAKTFFRRMAAEGIKMDRGLFDTLLSTHVRCRRHPPLLRCGRGDQRLSFPRHEEERAI
jgi:glucosyl-3-phosphoglycerate synthase